MELVVVDVGSTVDRMLAELDMLLKLALANGAEVGVGQVLLVERPFQLTPYARMTLAPDSLTPRLPNAFYLRRERSPSSYVVQIDAKLGMV